MSMESKVNRYKEIYSMLYQKYKWHVQTQILMFIPLIYILHNKDFNIKQFNSLCEYIKKNTSLFSPLHSYQRFPISAILLSKFNNPEEKFETLKMYQNKLLQMGFKKGPFLAMSALALMNTLDKDENIEMRIQKSIDIYELMKKNHFFLTNQNDYPLSILLSKSSKTTEEIVNEVEHYYEKLSEKNFKKGNDLQFLSHILMLANIENRDFLVYRCNNIYDKFIQYGLKTKRLHYPQMGIMAIVDSELEEEMKYIKEVVDTLNKEKKFKWLKEYNLTVAILLVISDLVKNINQDINIIETGLNTSMESIIQAQNAALVAFIASNSAINATFNLP